MYSRKKKPCSICRRWFEPDGRVAHRQHVCSSPECQRERRKRKQAVWRSSNPDYFAARRILERAGAKRRPEPLRQHDPLNRLPWDILQDAIGVVGADFLGILVGLLLRRTQSQRRPKPPDTS